MFLQNRLLRFFPFLTGLLTALMIAACASNPSAGPSGQANTTVPPGAADKLLVVDCLLPGQIRKLGTTMTYLTARRPIKTTASDCEIRGGEYVAYDRANYATALKIWLPPAEAGDPAAQTYVGEIYEKGLGLEPDYALAAQWYRKAADQAYSRAQINLGFLYEQGLGVPQDKSKALNLYRQASGLTNDQLAFTSSIEALEEEREAMRTERDELRQELALRNQEIELLRKQLNQTQEQLRTRRNNLEATQQDLEQTRQQLQKQRTAPSPAPTHDISSPQLERQLAQKEALLEQQRKELAYLQQEAELQKAQLTAEVRAAENRAEGLEQDVAAQAREKESLQRQVQFLEQQLTQYQTQLNERKQELETRQETLAQTQQALQQEQQRIATPTDNAELQRLQQQLEAKNQELARTRNQIATLEAAVEQRETELRTAQNQVNELQQDASLEAQERESLQQQVDYLQQQLVEQRDQLNTRKQELESQRRSLEQARQALERQQQISSTQDSAQLEQLKQALDSHKEELKRSQAQVATLEAQVEERREELDKLKTLRAEQIAMINTIRSGPATASKPVPAPEPSLPKIDFGRYYALIIGNNSYEQMPNLETAVNDAKTVASILRNHYGFETRVLTNATRYQILTALNEFREKLTEKDNFLLYYAGHGELDRVNDRGHWLPVDAEPASTANWISNIQITDILNAMNAKHVMVIADSCYSGTMARSVTTSIEGGRSDEQLREWLESMTQIRSRTVLTSGGVKPVLDAGGGGHSIFARALINTLKSNRDVLEGPILYSQVANQVKRIANQLNVNQDPRYAPLKFAGDLGAPFFFAAIN